MVNYNTEKRKRKHRTTEQYRNEVFEMVGEEYTVLGEYTKTKEPTLMRHETCGHEWSVRPNDFLRNRRCPICQRKVAGNKKMLTNAEYRKRISKSLVEFEQLTEYTGADNKIRFKHLKCGRTFAQRAKDFETRGTCSYCGIEQCGWGRRLSNESFVHTLPKGILQEYEILSEYVNSRTLIEVRRKSCGHKLKFIPYDLRKAKNSCAYCQSSKGERKVAKVLKENNIKFKHQFYFDDCKVDRVLRFDFGVLGNDNELKLLIEYDGEQHFKPIEGWGGMESYHYTIKRDLIKQQYCRENNIRLVRIRHDEYNQINKILKTLLS